jgi:hypothetical protein
VGSTGGSPARRRCHRRADSPRAPEGRQPNPRPSLQNVSCAGGAFQTHLVSSWPPGRTSTVLKGLSGMPDTRALTRWKMYCGRVGV